MTTTRISLVSSNIHTALTSWAAGEPTYLRQAGVAVVDVADAVSSACASDKDSKDTSVSSKSNVPFSSSKKVTAVSDKIYTVIPDGAPVLLKAITTAPVGSTDFQFVLKYALDSHASEEENILDPCTSTTTTNSTSSIDMTSLFEQVNTLVDPDYNPDTIAENVDLEDAELQVALVSSVSSEGLATLAKVYTDCVQRLKKCNGDVMNVLLTTAATGSGVDGNHSTSVDSETAAGGEKRRLSKAERKKQKTGSKPTTTATTTIAAASSNEKKSVSANNKPAVLLLQVTKDKENSTYKVALTTSVDVLKSYNDAI